MSKTLVKSPPELWAELEQNGLASAVGVARVRTTDPGRELAFEADAASGTVRLEPSSWGTKVTVCAETGGHASRPGLISRLRRARPPASGGDELEVRLRNLLDTLGQAHRKPFALG